MSRGNGAMASRRAGRRVLLMGLVSALPLAVQPPALATWSIVVADEETDEVAVGTVTCLTGLDLLAIVPVVVVGKGGAAVQASGDFAGTRRPIIFQHLMDGTPPDEILDILAGVSGHQSRQYGIADTQGRMVTFTGSATSQWAGGVVGADGPMVYAIQGNILAGGCVVPAIEQAIRDTAGDIPGKLMAGMEAAGLAGGDGRCSCSPSNPTGCGCPPGSFTKSGHIGTMVVARIGDGDDPVCSASGCADGDYFMKLNVAFQGGGDPDPVLQLRTQFDAWRAALVGRPDAGRSEASISPERLPADGRATATMLIQLRDWQGAPVAPGTATVSVTHAPSSAGAATIGEVVALGTGAFQVALTAGVVTGLDRFLIEADDGIRPVILMPLPALRFDGPGDDDGDGDVDLDDFLGFVDCQSSPVQRGEPDCTFYDSDADGDVDLDDFADFQIRFTG